MSVSNNHNGYGVRALQLLAILLCALLAFPPAPLRAQDAGPAQLNIVIVEGEGAVNNLRQRVVREPIVRVEDENHKPVGGALVTFLLPSNGAGGTFADGSHLLTVTTDSNGQAVARGIRTNNVSGKYQIQVRATKGNLSSSATISQANLAGAAGAAAAGGISAKLIAALVIVGAATAAGVAVAVTRGGGNGSSSSGSQPTVLTPGAPSVGGPH